MSTSTGEEGFCQYCGHAMNGHTKASNSKCKRCKRRILVCQVGVHDGGPGWRLCDIPCGCGESYFPSTARAAQPLHPEEFASTHPCYQSPEEPGEVDEDYEQTAMSPSVSASGATVDDVTGGESTGYAVDDVESQPTANWTHQRTASADSVDPLQWNEERYAEETVATSMAGLTIGEARAEVDVIEVSARYTKSGRVQFKLPTGETAHTDIEYWVATDEGYQYEYDGVVYYFTREIKRAKR